MRLTYVVALMVALSLTACAAERPLMYPNAHYKEVGPTTAEQDINDCMQLAESAGAQPSRSGPDAEGVAVNTGTGAASGAARGAVYGNAGKGAAAGAAGAAAGSVFRGIFTQRSNPAHRRFVELCLRERGYQVTGWQ